MLVKFQWSPVKMRLILSLRPKFCELRLFFQNLRNAAALNQPLVIKSGGAFYSISHVAWRFSHQSKTPPLDVEHVLEPCFDPAANRDVATHLLLFGIRFGNQRRESA